MKTFKSRFITFSWICGIYIGIVICLATVGAVYNIPSDTLFNKIFNVVFVITVPTVLSWLGTAVYGELNGKLDDKSKS
jgi:hypothetical protein